MAGRASRALNLTGREGAMTDKLKKQAIIRIVKKLERKIDKFLWRVTLQKLDSRRGKC